LHYKGTRLDQTYQPDFLCYDQIIVELKAAKALADDHRAQTINYLKATRKRLGLLVNFGHYPKLEAVSPATVVWSRRFRGAVLSPA